MPQASLRCDSTCIATVDDRGGQRRGRSGRGIGRAADRGEFVARDVGDQFGDQIRLRREIAIDGAGGDIGADRDRRDLHRGHAGFGGGIARGRENGAAPRRKALHDLMGPPIDHGAFRPGTRVGRHHSTERALHLSERFAQIA